MRKWLHIVLVLLLVVSCGPRKISRDDMEKIMTEMLLQDQQIKMDRNLKREADTCLVYDGIFKAYGYDTDDFLYSLEYYISDPARMEKIMGKVAETLEKEAQVVTEEIDFEQWKAHFMRIYYQQPDTTLPHPRARAVDSLYLRFDADSVSLYHPADSL